ncbi:ABC transporter ATP-binding protein [Variovorax terrae]|uniref:ABC transporter ATP-binding protein n=1 Tax=Variovorax terrae TaxID=2923278 RepID=A0A9X2AQV8_9BURK|nr:ABC transporter ATP-binding protein [Variovorax terrae]MCJ0764902.1 ABC transporter ATP-binding protein [Variovorax terrae]
MTPVLETNGLAGGYGELSVFHGVTLTLASNEVLGILGPNGAGKTTLLRTLAGLLPQQGGTVNLEGRSLGRAQAWQRARAGLVMVPEGRQIIPGLTVLENLELTRASGRSGSDAASFNTRVEQAWELFPRLAERRHQPGDALSGGEQQMLAIARALMMQPKALLLDEPTQGLAPIVVQELRGVLQKLVGRFAILLVEQNRAFMAGVVTRSAEMRDGRLVAI